MIGHCNKAASFYYSNGPNLTRRQDSSPSAIAEFFSYSWVLHHGWTALAALWPRLRFPEYHRTSGYLAVDERFSTPSPPFPFGRPPVTVEHRLRWVFLRSKAQNDLPTPPACSRRRPRPALAGGKPKTAGLPPVPPWAQRSPASCWASRQRRLAHFVGPAKIRPKYTVPFSIYLSI
jgi:hypothetical protein